MEVSMVHEYLPNMKWMIETCRCLDEESHQATLAMIAKVFGRVFRTEEILKEIDVEK